MLSSCYRSVSSLPPSLLSFFSPPSSLSLLPPFFSYSLNSDVLSGTAGLGSVLNICCLPAPCSYPPSELGMQLPPLHSRSVAERVNNRAGTKTIEKSRPPPPDATLSCSYLAPPAHTHISASALFIGVFQRSPSKGGARVCVLEQQVACSAGREGRMMGWWGIPSLAEAPVCHCHPPRHFNGISPEQQEEDFLQNAIGISGDRVTFS